MTIRDGSIVRIDVVASGKAGRVGVVLRQVTLHGQAAALVAWGTPTLHAHLVHMVVEPEEPAGVALGLAVPTYFYAKNGWIGAVEMLHIARAPCPPYLLAALRVLFGFASPG